MLTKTFLATVMGLIMLFSATEAICQERNFRFSLNEDDARKFISYSFKNSKEMLMELDRAKAEATTKRNEFLTKLNSDSALFHSFIKDPLFTLNKYKLLDITRSVTLEFSPEIIERAKEFLENPPSIFCGRGVYACCAVESKECAIVFICTVESKEFMGLSACLHWAMIESCTIVYRLVPCTTIVSRAVQLPPQPE